MALPTNGRVIIRTTAGEVDVELWSKEAPKACRNFIALALEGYYDGVIFHRVVPGFLVQTGDRTGTGAGGESFFGEPFEDEIHPRLRFAHRGLVGMANNGKKNSNDSQFFMTLDRADELHGKHTLFGRVVGDTVFNVLKIGEMEIDENERPLYPPKILSVTIVENPFPDIVPRITAAEKRAQQRAREKGQKEREEAERRRGAKKNVKLLSFGDDEGEEDTQSARVEKKNIARPDLVNDPSGLSMYIPESFLPPTSSKSKDQKPDQKPVPEPLSKKDQLKRKETDVTKIREQHAKEKASESNARRADIEQMEEEIRRLKRKRDGEDSDEEAEWQQKEKPKSYLEAELAKYSKGRGLRRKAKEGRRKDEGDVLAALNNLRGLLQTSTVPGAVSKNAGSEEADAPEETIGEDPAVEIDDDRGFMTHVLCFAKDDGEETRKAERDYEVIDPRQRSARAREEERERKRATKGRGMGRSRR